ncbi:hypothetical protein PJ311_03485 [Bacillus sp. CLL-7-23]|uniref:Uncharacterized protein n=1 Tax=Bacillus changyiensis TaxID=3004103 RepID=A0ABT4X067_9BACI|nr:hypothetical protein [Bacillus changyiensis]MDA7025674.1 hypothetical protein [Bacillus changyiensis]
MEQGQAQTDLDQKEQTELELLEDEFPSRRSYHEKKKNSKKKNQNRNPLFTILAVLFFFIPIIVFIVFMYMINQDQSDPHQYDDVFYENDLKKTSEIDERMTDWPNQMIAFQFTKTKAT